MEALHTQVAQVAVAQPVGKGQLVSIWQCHLEFVSLKGHGELQWGERCQRGRRGPGHGPVRCLVDSRPCTHTLLTGLPCACPVTSP